MGRLYPSPPQGSGTVMVEETERLEESEIGEDQSTRVSLVHDQTTAFMNSHKCLRRSCIRTSQPVFKPGVGRDSRAPIPN